MTPPPSRRRRPSSKSVEPAQAKRWCCDCAEKATRSGPPNLQAPSREDAGDIQDRLGTCYKRDFLGGWGLFKNKGVSQHPVLPQSFQASSVKASAQRPVGTANAASTHDESWYFVAQDESASPTPMTPPRPSQRSLEQTAVSLSSYSDTSTAYRDSRTFRSTIRVIPPARADAQRGNKYIGNPSATNAAFLQPGVFQTSAILPPQQRLSWNQSRVPTMLSELQGHLQYTKKCRMKLKNLRAQIRAVQDKKLDAENAFQSAALRSTVQPTARKTLLKLSGVLDTTRNEAYTLQMEYETLERELEQSQTKLEKSQMELFQELEISQVPGTHIPTRGSSGSDSPQMLDFQEEAYPDRSIFSTQESLRAGFPTERDNTAFAVTADEAFREMVGNETTDVPPLFRKLISTVTELKMAEEELDDILEERQEIVSTLYTRFLIAASVDKTQQIDEAKMEQVRAVCDSLFSVGMTAEFRDLFGPFLVSSDSQFLEDFDIAEKKVLAAIREYTEQVARLRSECLRTGAIPNHLATRERVVMLGEEDDGAHDISIDPTPVYNIPVGQSRLPNPLAHAYFPYLRQNCWYMLTKSPMTAKSALSHMLQLPSDFPYRAARIEDLVKEYGIETMLTRFALENKADFVNRWLLQQLRMSSVNELQLFVISSRHLDILDLAVWERSAISFWSQDGTNTLEKPIHGSEVFSSLPTAWKTAVEVL